MQFVILDTDAAHNRLLAGHLDAICKKQGFTTDISLVTTDPEAVRAFAKECSQPAVYFMAVQLDEHLTSLPLCEEIFQNGRESYIVYISAHPEYALECLHTHAFDFLVKPWTDEQLLRCLQAIMHAHARFARCSVLRIPIGNRLVAMPTDDILYFDRNRMNIRMFLTDGSILEWRESFDHLLERLEGESFCLCHRSFVVNLQKIRIIDWDQMQLTLPDGTQLPISRRKVSALKSALQNF